MSNINNADFSTKLNALNAYNKTSNTNLNDLINDKENLTKTNSTDFFAELKKVFFDKPVKSLKASEDIGSKAILNKASLTDLVTTINEAEILIESVVTAQKKFIESYQEIMRMAV
jgi:flagellar hook-basal body complex protein FliE